MVTFPNGKINLGLLVKEKRADGYHNLETIFYPVKIFDILDLVKSTGDFSFTQTGQTIDLPPAENICVKAWEIMKAAYPFISEIKMHLHKLIPSGAGLGGGSADATFVLQSINKIFTLDLPYDKIVQHAMKLGSDCPFFIINKPAFATGRGEILQPIEIDLSPYQLVVVNPGIHVNTGQAFKMLKLQTGNGDLRELVKRPIAEWKGSLINDFEPVVFSIYPEIEKLKERLYEAGSIYASMSGTGSSCYGIFPKDVKPELSLPGHYKIFRIKS